MGVVSGVDGVARLLAFKTYPTGLCLQAVSKALGTYTLTSDKPGYYTYALRVYERVPKGRLHTDRTPPKGAVVFFSAGGNGFGHICLSGGGGKIVSTDVPQLGRVGTTTISALEKAWGRTYLGWSDWMMGHTVTYAKPAPASVKSHPATVRVGSRGSAVKTLQKKLGGLTVDGIFGPKTLAKVRAFQKKKRLVVDGIVGPKTWAALGL